MGKIGKSQGHAGHFFFFLIGAIVSAVVFRRDGPQIIEVPCDKSMVGTLEHTAPPKSASAVTGWSSVEIFYGDQNHLIVEPAEWKSEAGQDATVMELLKGLKGGFFVDLAANDATFISNTYSLEAKYDWNGLCIEANSKYWNRLAYRNCQVVGAVVGHQRMEEIDFFFGNAGFQEVVNVEKSPTWDRGALGGIVGKQFDRKQTRGIVAKRYTVTLEEIFQRFNVPKVIDYFSLDVEGAETYIMSGFPFDSYKFRVMSVERPKDDLKELLRSKDYLLYKTLGRQEHGETIWIHQSFNDTLGTS